MTQRIEFYFDFGSPFGYLASRKIEGLAACFGRDVDWKPVMLGPLFKATGAQPNLNVPVKGEYFKRDMFRTARFLGVPFKVPPKAPPVTLAAARAYWWLAGRDPDLAKRAAVALYDACWGEGRDIMAPTAVGEVLAPLGVDPDELKAAVASDAVKQRLKDETQAAADRGVFGSPFVIVGDEPFWGVDRFDQLEKWLETGGF